MACLNCSEHSLSVHANTGRNFHGATEKSTSLTASILARSSFTFTFVACAFAVVLSVVVGSVVVLMVLR